MRTLTVLSPGPLSTIQDVGRPGYGHLGVGSSGAADPFDLELVNRILGNDRQTAAIEATLGRLRVRVNFDGTVAVTGAPCAIDVAGRPEPMNTRINVQAGEEIRLGAPAVGLRTYLGVAGGIDSAVVLGSRSTDTLSGLGPGKLAAGMVL